MPTVVLHMYRSLYLALILCRAYFRATYSWYFTLSLKWNEAVFWMMSYLSWYNMHLRVTNSWTKKNFSKTRKYLPGTCLCIYHRCLLLCQSHGCQTTADIQKEFLDACFECSRLHRAVYHWTLVPCHSGTAPAPRLKQGNISDQQTCSMPFRYKVLRLAGSVFSHILRLTKPGLFGLIKKTISKQGRSLLCLYFVLILNL